MATSPSRGRQKEIIVTAGGKNVSPNYLEDPIRSNPIVSQVVVAGDQKPFISASSPWISEMIDTWLSNNGVSEKLSLDEGNKAPHCGGRSAASGRCREQQSVSGRVGEEVCNSSHRVHRSIRTPSHPR